MATPTTPPTPSASPNPSPSPTPLAVREVTTEADLREAFEVVRVLRHRLTAVDEFLDLVRRQRAEGYVLVAGYVGGRPVAVAGYRFTSTLFRGPHLFVDDLVTAPAEQGKGYGAAMVDWLRAAARSAGVDRVFLDSRDSAVGFYERLGFTFATSKPCSIAAADEA